MADNFIQLKDDSSILRLEIYSKDGIATGDYLEFDMEDIELPMRYQDLIEEDKKNRNWLKNQLFIISKRQDVKGKKLWSKNEEDKIRAVEEFLKKEVKVYNMFLGENGVEKILCGRKLGWTTLSEIDKIIEEQILPNLDITLDSLKDKIEKKYSKIENKEVLK